MSARRRAAPASLERFHPAVWQAASVLLDYPDHAQRPRLEMLRPTLAALPGALAEPLRRVADHLTSGDPWALQQDYVETFDSRRRHNLFLTYFAHGDTRKRGVALLRFKQTYQASGVVLDDGELPDHLCVVLEYAATVDHERGRALLLDHRAGLELLRLSLADTGSAWAGAVEAVCATLPELCGDEREAVRRLAAEGPPAEEVGLTPYGTPQFDASLDTVAGGPVDLPLPTVRGA